MSIRPSPEFGVLFADLRNRLGFSQRSMAAFLEVDESTVSKVEYGTRLPFQQGTVYERLPSIPGVVKSDVEMLLGARVESIPGLTNLEKEILKRAHAIDHISQDGEVDVGVFKVDFSISVPADRIHCKQELAALATLTALAIRLRLHRSFLLRNQTNS